MQVFIDDGSKISHQFVCFLVLKIFALIGNMLVRFLLSSDIRHDRHCVFQLHVHLVLVTKYRSRIFNGDAINRLRAIFTNVCNDFESPLVEMDGRDNHVHLLVNYPPKHAVSALVHSLKGVSSRLLRLARPALARRYWKGVLWSPSYFAASCGGASIGILKAYIEQQKTPF